MNITLIAEKSIGNINKKKEKSIITIKNLKDAGLISISLYKASVNEVKNKFILSESYINDLKGKSTNKKLTQEDVMYISINISRAEWMVDKDISSITHKTLDYISSSRNKSFEDILGLSEKTEEIVRSTPNNNSETGLLRSATSIAGDIARNTSLGLGYNIMDINIEEDEDE